MPNFSPSTNNEHANAILIEQAPTAIDALRTKITLKTDDDLLESLIALPQDIDFNHVDPTLNTMLYTAASNDKIKAVSYLLCERRVNPNVQVVENQTAIHLAIARGNLSIVQLLANRPNIDLQLQNDFGETPLFMSIGDKEMNIDIVKLMVSKEPTAINIANEDGATPIDIALLRKSPELIELFLDNGAKVSDKNRNLATSMLMENSTETNKHNVSFFSRTLPENADIYKCATLIIKHYNKHNLADDLLSSGPK